MSGTSVFAGFLRIARGLRLLRLSRLLRFLKPIAPTLIRLLDRRINKNLSAGYDVGKAFVVAHEEVARLVPTVMDYPPHILHFKDLCERSRVELIKAMGMLNEDRPDIAVAVKTRQSIRHVLNQLRKRIRELNFEGVIDEEEATAFEEALDSKVKRLSRFPHRIPIPSAMQLLRHLPWLEDMPEDVYDFMHTQIEEREYSKEEVIAKAGELLDGIILITVGVVRLTFIVVDDFMEYSDCVFFEVNEDQFEEYLPRGNALNEPGCLLGIKRSSTITAASDPVKVSVASLNARVYRCTTR